MEVTKPIKTNSNWKMLYEGDIVLIPEIINEIVGEIERWQKSLTCYRLTVNDAKAKYLNTVAE